MCIIKERREYFTAWTYNIMPGKSSRPFSIAPNMHTIITLIASDTDSTSNSVYEFLYWTLRRGDIAASLVVITGYDVIYITQYYTINSQSSQVWHSISSISLCIGTLGLSKGKSRLLRLEKEPYKCLENIPVERSKQNNQSHQWCRLTRCHNNIMLTQQHESHKLPWPITIDSSAWLV